MTEKPVDADVEFAAEPEKVGWSKWGPTALAAAALALFLYLRLRNLGHLLLWDEAQFCLYTRSLAQGLNDFWRPLVSIHPPLYLWICALLSKAYGGGAISYEIVSILFSLGTLLVTWRLAHDLFGRWAGALAMFFLAVLPAATVIDTWIKQDAAAVFFLTLTIYLFMRKKYVLSGVALGLGMLSKEIAIFALLVLGIYALASWRRSLVWGVVKVGLIGGALSVWWYLWVSTTVGSFGDFFLGKGEEAQIWRQPWYYYFKGLPTDVGWLILILGLAGCLVCLVRLCKGSRSHSLPLIWLMAILAFLSISMGKPYWMIASALPAMAILAALGMEEIVKLAGHLLVPRKARLSLQVALAASILIAALVGAVTLEYGGYNRERLAVYWNAAEKSRQEAEFLNSVTEKDDRLYMIFTYYPYALDAVLLFYLEPSDVIGVTGQGIEAIRQPQQLLGYLRSIGVDWIFLGKSETYAEEIQAFLESLPEYVQVEAVYETDSAVIIKLGG